MTDNDWMKRAGEPRGAIARAALDMPGVPEPSRWSFVPPTTGGLVGGVEVARRPTGAGCKIHWAAPEADWAWDVRLGVG